MCSLVQKEVLKLLHTQVVVLILGTHIPLCLPITWTIVLKHGIHNPHLKKVLSVYTILFADFPTFPDIMHIIQNATTKTTGFKYFGTFSDKALP